MHNREKHHEQDAAFNLMSILEPIRDQKIISLPLQFQYLPVDIISKQFTKLNSQHIYRIHYLGPRFTNGHVLHKKYSIAGQYVGQGNNSLYNILNCQRYQINMKKIVQSHFITQKLKNNHYYKSAIYYRAFEGMNPSLNLGQQYIFNSAFQCGNLDCAIKIKENQFDLFLRIDSNTRGHLQWYYFSVKNGQKLGKVIFHICNISKGGTLYENGLKPYVFSTKKHNKYNKNWQQDGQSITFLQKSFRYNLIYQRVNFSEAYQLSFEYNFDQKDDEVFFSYCIPYSYSQLLKDIKQLPSKFVLKETLGRTLTGADIPILHITNHEEKKIKKKNVLITGRIHPGQSNGSYVLKGFLNFLCSQQAKQLRNRVNFIVVPMLNIDGVIMGNTRSSAAGKDLNRQYKTSNQQLFPQVCLIKNLAFKIKRKYGLLFYLDFHGHSRRKNTFFYGPSYALTDAEYYKCRMLPKIIQKITNTFRYHSCSFMISEQKKSTARAVLFQHFKIPYTYTIESSIGFYYDSQLKQTFPYDMNSWESIGFSISKGLLNFIVSLEQFQQLVKQRKIQRKKAKQRRQKQQQLRIQNKKQYLDQQLDETIKIDTKNLMFFDLVQQIKASAQNKQLEPELSSDDHDEKEDLQLGKFAQFNTLVNGNKGTTHFAKKLQGLDEEIKFTNKRKLSFDQDKDQLNIISEICEQKNKKEQTKKQKFNFIPKNSYRNKFIPKIMKQKKINILTRSQGPTMRQCSNHRQSQEKSKSIKIISKKLMKSDSTNIKCLVLARQFFPQPKCQVIQFPKRSQTQNIRRDQKFVRSMQGDEVQFTKDRLSSFKKQIKNNQRRRDRIGNVDITERYNKRVYKLSQFNHNNINGQYKQDPIFSKPYRQGDSKKKHVFFANKNISQDIKKKYENYSNGVYDEHFHFEGIQLDNMAMKIKTFTNRF